ncbi:MAG: ribose 5-phosphate isomerase [Patescibacteria group bacterium]|nr:ribose 5-phosphate isomerase [Patescibacteria group bacterium]
MVTTVYVGADHAGFGLKNSLKEYLEMKGFVVEDLGAHELDLNDDYPEYATAVAQAVRKHAGSFGILSCGNAEGIAIAANKFQGIRAGIGYSVEAAKTMRSDDIGNVLAIPGRLPVQDEPLEIAETFLRTPFSGAARHERRLEQIAEIES